MKAANPKAGWIFGSFLLDALFVLGPALLGFLLSRAIQPMVTSAAAKMALFLVYGWVDSGHVWSTIWRTHFCPQERHRLGVWAWLPLGVILGIFLWLASGLPGFWVFAVVATLFHNQRQLWGVVRWYDKLGAGRTKELRWVFWGFAALPALAYVARPIDPGHYYLVPHDIPHISSPRAFWLLTYLWFGLVFLWCASQVWNMLQRRWRPGVAFGLASTAIIYGGGFFGARTVMDIAFPLVLSHGICYLAIMTQTSRRIGIPLAGGTLGWGVMLGTALAGGLLAHFLLEETDFSAWRSGPGALWVCAAVALYFGPTLTHYLYDSWLWTGRHPEARRVFGAGTVAPTAGAEID